MRRDSVCERERERERARERDRRGAEPKPQILNPKQGCQIEALKPINRAEHFVCVLERTNGSNKYL
jgi:hypothetical protein